MNTLRKLYPYIRPYRAPLLVAVAGAILAAALASVPPLLFRRLVDDVIVPRQWAAMAWLLPLLAIVPCLSAFMRFVNVRQLVRTSRRFLADMRMRLYRRLLRLPIGRYTSHSSGMLVGRMMDDVNQMQKLMTGQTINTVVDGLTLVFSVTACLTISPMLSLVLGGMLGLYIWTYKRWSPRIRGASQGYRNVFDRISGRLQETLNGVRQVRVLQTEGLESSLFQRRLRRALSRARIGAFHGTAMNLSCNAVAAAGAVVSLTLGSLLVIDGSISHGDLLAFHGYLWMAASPAVRLTALVGELQQTFVSAGRILEVLDWPAEDRGPQGPVPAPNGPIRFENVSFSYPGGQPLFRGLDFRIDEGTRVALAGHSGCGKTTVTSLLLRYWDVDGGAITLGGTDIRRLPLHTVRRRFAVVPQSPVIFEGTLAENIAYGRPSVGRKSIEEAAQASELDSLLSRMPHGLDTRLGMSGIRLSQGERQRLAIARALAADAPVLILDEATSALDPESEALVQAALDRLLRGRTALIIAHRLSTIRSADRILVMDHGSLMEQGRHEELMESPVGTYRRFYTLLAGKDERLVTG